MCDRCRYNVGEEEVVGFLDEVLSEQSRTKKCGLGDALRAMDPKEFAEVRDALADRSLEHSSIFRVLKKRGYKVNRWQVRDCRVSCECGALTKGDNA